MDSSAHVMGQTTKFGFIDSHVQVTSQRNGRLMATRLLIERADKRWAWHLAADNGDVIATDGSQGYENEDDARDMADRIISGEFKDADRKIRRL